MLLVACKLLYRDTENLHNRANQFVTKALLETIFVSNNRRYLCNKMTAKASDSIAAPVDFRSNAIGFSWPSSGHWNKQFPSVDFETSSSVPNDLPYSTTCNLVALHKIRFKASNTGQAWN